MEGCALHFEILYPSAIPHALFLLLIVWLAWPRRTVDLAVVHEFGVLKKAVLWYLGQYPVGYDAVYYRVHFMWTWQRQKVKNDLKYFTYHHPRRCCVGSVVDKML